MNPIYVLIHSPLVGPATWAPVRESLRRQGMQALTPALIDDDGIVPYWRQHAESVARSLSGDRPLVLIGHSGAGPILPVIGQSVRQPVAAYVFVDAGIPIAGLSRLALMETEDAGFAAQLREHLEAGGRFPEWSEEQLRDVIPDVALRHAVIDEMMPRPLAFFNEPIPVPDGWPDAPCTYIQFSPAYDVPAARAREMGWTYRRINGGHFHMLVEPDMVARGIIEMTQMTRGEQ